TEAKKNKIRKLNDHVPMQSIGIESDVFAAIVLLLSPGANFSSGNTLRIDGAAIQGTRAWTLCKAKNSESYNGFHRAYLPDVLKDQEQNPCRLSNPRSTCMARTSPTTAKPCWKPWPAFARSNKTA